MRKKNYSNNGNNNQKEMRYIMVNILNTKFTKKINRDTSVDKRDKGYT